MTNNPGYFGIGGVDGPSVYPQNIYNPHGDYGVSGFDTRNAANFVGTYAIPFGHGRDLRLQRQPLRRLGHWWLEDVLGCRYVFRLPDHHRQQQCHGLEQRRGARANQYHKLTVRNRSLAHWFGTGPSATPCTLLPSSAGQNPSCAYGNELNALPSGNSTLLEQRTSAPNGHRDIASSIPRCSNSSAPTRSSSFNSASMRSTWATLPPTRHRAQRLQRLPPLARLRQPCPRLVSFNTH